MSSAESSIGDSKSTRGHSQKPRQKNNQRNGSSRYRSKSHIPACTVRPTPAVRPRSVARSCAFAAICGSRCWGRRSKRASSESGRRSKRPCAPLTRNPWGDCIRVAGGKQLLAAALLRNSRPLNDSGETRAVARGATAQCLPSAGFFLRPVLARNRAGVDLTPPGAGFLTARFDELFEPLEIAAHAS